MRLTQTTSTALSNLKRTLQHGYFVAAPGRDLLALS